MNRFIIDEAEQRSAAWFQARAGRATGSKADAVLAKIKSGEAAARRDYRLQLAVERLTGTPQENGYINAAMQRGIDMEPVARAVYEAMSGHIVRCTGFLSMADHMAGCSLDGDVDDFQRLLSVKCPNAATHVSYLKGRRLPPEYVPQATHEMWVTGAEYYDFVSFDDRLPEGLQYFCVTVERGELDIRGYETEITRFLAEVEAEVEALQKLRTAA